MADNQCVIEWHDGEKQWCVDVSEAKQISKARYSPVYQDEVNGDITMSLGGHFLGTIIPTDETRYRNRQRMKELSRRLGEHLGDYRTDDRIRAEAIENLMGEMGRLWRTVK